MISHSYWNTEQSSCRPDAATPVGQHLDAAFGTPLSTSPSDVSARSMDHTRSCQLFQLNLPRALCGLCVVGDRHRLRQHRGIATQQAVAGASRIHTSQLPRIADTAKNSRCALTPSHGPFRPTPRPDATQFSDSESSQGASPDRNKLTDKWCEREQVGPPHPGRRFAAWRCP